MSLKAPGSTLDLANPGASVGTRQMRGSGTSQAAAMVSGAAALIIEQRPGITPDQVKALLNNTARDLPAADPRAQGAGMIDLSRALTTPTPGSSAVQTWTKATDKGSLDAARGSGRLMAENVELSGERDIFGKSFSSSTWATKSAAGAAWSGGSWNGSRWSGDVWSGSLWSGDGWAGQPVVRQPVSSDIRPSGGWDS